MSKLMTFSLGAAMLLVAGQTVAVAQGIPPGIQQQIQQYTGGGQQQGYQQNNQGYGNNQQNYGNNQQGSQGYGNNQQANQGMSKKQRAQQTQMQQMMKNIPPQYQQYIQGAMGGGGMGGGM